jgi:dihydrofolate reductase
MFLAGIAVLSLDGCLTRHEEPGTAFASEADHEFFRAALQTFDCSIAGRLTYEAGRESILRRREGPRLQMVLTSTPARFAADALPGHLEFRDADTKAVAGELARRGRSRCALLGGARLYTEACAHDLLDELWITLEPVAFGTGGRMFEGRLDVRFDLANVEALSGGTLLLKYRRRGAKGAPLQEARLMDVSPA